MDAYPPSGGQNCTPNDMELSVGHPGVPTNSAGVFHAWYVSRLEHEEAAVILETGGQVTRESYLKPLQARLRTLYGLQY